MASASGAVRQDEADVDDVGNRGNENVYENDAENCDATDSNAGDVQHQPYYPSAAAVPIDGSGNEDNKSNNKRRSSSRVKKADDSNSENDLGPGEYVRATVVELGRLPVSDDESSSGSTSTEEGSEAEAEGYCSGDNKERNKQNAEDEGNVEVEYVTATALDPWMKVPTVSSALAQGATLEELQQDSQMIYPTAVMPTNYIEHPTHKKLRRRRRRRGRMLVSGAAGFVVGSFILGPVGAVVGAACGATVARAASKVGERGKDKRVRRQFVRSQVEFEYNSRMQEQQRQEQEQRLQRLQHVH